jgi:hypothetical protein
MGLFLIKNLLNMEKLFNITMGAVAVTLGSTLVYAISFAVYQLVVNGHQSVNI